MTLKYWQRVRVKSWFYEGMVGTLFYESQSNTWVDDYYGVLIDKWTTTERTLSFQKDNLEIIL